ncbi:hypothetical protein CWO27_23265 [Vibrio sp. 10N.286.51.C3]|uniref:hypothetical protein n=1 Tax=unclassified Vibrio TaxID=2614977 RepID=UPI000D3D2871|nr:MULTISPECIES: hypothetical protein [unclassified Vibrio]PTP11445.1 hypothetical protein CWO27_23265 [Vibrio sp. 10N.286.51.C3]TKE60079.1 hypothetical protein FCV45_22990 [Vibrio sp. F12]
MSKIEQKLRENHHRREREALIRALPKRISDFLEGVEYSSDVNCIRYAAFSTWDEELDCLTTTRGNIENWNNHNFKYWEDLIGKFKELPISDTAGWLFFDCQGPYYKVQFTELHRFLTEIEMYTKQTEIFDFGWVGEELDCGVIAEFNQTSFCRNEFELSVWGI